MPNGTPTPALGFGACPSGMAPVDDFCIDRYEAMLVDISGTETMDQRQSPGFVIRVEYLDQACQPIIGHTGTDLDADGVGEIQRLHFACIEATSGCFQTLANVTCLFLLISSRRGKR